MKKIIINLIVCICFASCTLSEFDPQTWAIYPELELSESGLVFTNFERERVVSIKTNYQEVSVNSSENWCHPKIETGCLRINVDPNEAIQQREATVSVKVSRGNKSLSRDLSIVQLGGYWDIVGDFSVFWSNESLSNTQKEIINNILTNMQKIDGGFFYMGSQNVDENGINYFPFLNQNNVNRAAVEDFYISKYEVTQKEWSAIMGYNNSVFTDPDKPIDNVTWEEAMIFTQQLSGITGLKISLPTEAQWEYAAKGGVNDMEYIYPGSNDYKEVAHHVPTQLSEYSPLYTTCVPGLFKPNSIDLYDMAGNVAEYCANYDSQSFNIRNEDIIVKGGCFNDDYTRFSIPSAYNSSQFIGIRLVVNK